ncbi:serine/threonine-protein kinase Sgk2 [Metarhizium album ARSEF 1941]|uniref:EKC/KEOPS complex subunit BUD32 n=1 Tax=Metarhizium album (strain ARSEF 1941) TaxID=1081103 RepID=A0A0B2X5F0_METAS|nr:serine/threonine-protein kinase Sgk2 [Metarhizium album ARSEF 1941]KHO00536.1 serine/threonine-protein kinase Sgk2 [Metarhizium album ARSEF 1941]
MAHLTQEERDIVDANPLGDSLGGIREALRKAERHTHHEASQSDDSTAAPERPRLFVAAIGKIFSILSASDVSLALASRTGREALVSDLTAIRLRVQKGDLKYKQFRPLSQLVIKQAPDVDIWAAVVALIRSISHSTPPPSLPPSFESRMTHSSASQQGSEQTRRKIEPRVFEEIRYCTHRAVAGFHEKYFEGHKWNMRARRIWQSANSRYSDKDKRWTQLPDAATKDEVCGWLLNLQEELLATERAAYFRSNRHQKVRAESSEQLDLFVKMKRDEASDTKHDWKHVLVVGELKQSHQKNKSLWLQVGSAVRNVFAYQPTRFFVHAFTLTGTEMETWIFDRSGPYSGTTFDIHKEPEKFIRVICAYLMMSDEELGLDTFTKAKDNRLLVTIPVEARGKKQQLELNPNPIAHQRAIVCRGTSCFLAKATGAAVFDGVVKYSWTSSMRPPETDLLKKANERGVKGLAKLVGYNEVTSISRLREGLVFSTPHNFPGMSHGANTSFSQSQPPLSQSFSQFPGLSIASSGHRKRKATDGSSNASKRSRPNNQVADTEHKENGATYPAQEPQGISLVQQDHDQTPYANRIFRVLAISPAGRSITQFKGVIELLEGLCDAIKVHRSLYTDGKILHRDISENNIIITDPENADGFKGMLIDLDLAKEEGKGPSGARHRTGTMEFMAIEVLLGISHTYRHDLEAFFYVLIWLCARRGWALSRASGQRPKKSMLSRWYTGGYEDIAQSKRGDMDKNGLEVILREFPEAFDGVKPLCRAVRDVLFPHKDGLFTGTPQDPNILYDPIIKAFNDTIAEIGLGEAKT